MNQAAPTPYSLFWALPTPQTVQGGYLWGRETEGVVNWERWVFIASHSIFVSLNSQDINMCYLYDSFKTKKKEAGQLLVVCEGPRQFSVMSNTGSSHVYLDSGPSPVLLSTVGVRPAQDPEQGH